MVCAAAARALETLESAAAGIMELLLPQRGAARRHQILGCEAHWIYFSCAYPNQIILRSIDHTHYHVRFVMFETVDFLVLFVCNANDMMQRRSHAVQD